MSIAPPDPNTAQVSRIRLRSMRAGLHLIRELLSEEASTDESCVIRFAMEHLDCIEKELRYAETYPMSLFEKRQCHRLSSYCREAATAIVGMSGPSTTSASHAQALSVAFLGLVPRLLEDYDRVLRRRLHLHFA